jgi:hypothetical protein
MLLLIEELLPVVVMMTAVVITVMWVVVRVGVRMWVRVMTMTTCHPWAFTTHGFFDFRELVLRVNALFFARRAQIVIRTCFTLVSLRNFKIFYKKLKIFF